MTKEQAIRLMEQGKKVTHRYFSPKEFATIKNGQIVTEEGYSVPMKEFWAYRNIEGWNDGWEEFVESKALPSPGDNQSLEEEIETEAAEYATGMMGIGEYNEKNWAYADKQTWHLIKRAYMRAAWKHPSRPSIDIVDELRKANPYEYQPMGDNEGFVGWNKCCYAIEQLLNQKEAK